jgi:hypothetical protein
VAKLCPSSFDPETPMLSTLIRSPRPAALGSPRSAAPTADFADTRPAVQTLRGAGGDRRDPGFQLGWEHARHGVLPPAEHLLPLSPVRQGWEAGRVAFAGRTREADVAVRQWLQLKLRAWLAGTGFEGVQVTPAFLRRIATVACPVTRERFAGADDGSDRIGTVSPMPMRLWREAGCAAGNLALLSPRAARALARSDAQAAMQQADAMAADDVHAGLRGREWARLAALLSLPTPLPHAVVASRPLVLLPPPRVRLLNPVHGLQVLISLREPGAGQGRRDALLAALMPHAEGRYALADLHTAMLVRRRAPAQRNDAQAQREAIEDLWTDGLVQRRWQRLVSRLSADDCESITRLALARGAAGERLQWLPAANATEGWGALA